MKDFKKFLEEITIKGNEGIPGEPKRRYNDKSYLDDVEKRAKDRLGLSGVEDPMRVSGQLMPLVNRSMQMTRGKEKELELLAEEIIRLNYDSILQNVILDIKLVRPGNVKEFMDSEDESEIDPPPNYKLLEDPEIKKEVHKGKIINNIIQGEAKNTKHMLHLPEVKEGLDEIFNQRDSDELFRLWVTITSLADKMDWIIPIDVKADMIEEHPEGLAGAVKVDWKPKEPKEPKESKEPKDPEEKKEEENVYDEYTPIIRARGVDFPMLLHESVKGIYELIGASSIPREGADPDDIRIAQIVKLNTSSFEDEAEDFRYGPEIAADLRDFINKNPDIDRHPNIREHVFGKMVDREKMSADEFLKLMKGILSNSKEARQKIDNLVNEVISELNEWEMGEIIGHNQTNFNHTDDETDDEVNTIDGEYEDENIKNKEEEIDYSKLSAKQLDDEINAALDSGDYKKAHYINSFIKHKESKAIYTRELEIINEKINLHSK